MEFLHNAETASEKKSLKELKAELRKTLLGKRRELSSQQKNDFDAAICRRLLSSAAYRYSDTLLLYSPLADEVDITSVAEQAYKQGKTVAYPRCIPGSADMQFHVTAGLHELKSGSFSIKEPSADAPIWVPGEHEHALCLIPGIAFDLDGYRIGYGKGYYDRYFKSDCPILKIGVVYSEAILSRLPHGRFDIAVDAVITEKQLLTVKH